MVAKSRDDDGRSHHHQNQHHFLLYTLICMVGLPVEVQVKDGSVYSGIFHTASFDKDHGIVLKKAQKIGKGKHENNFTIGSFVDTLVVYSTDFVQVVAKDFLLPVEGINVSCELDVTGTIYSDSERFPTYNSDLERAPKPSISGNTSPSGSLDYNKEKMSVNGQCNENVKVDGVHKPFDEKKEDEAKRHDMRKVREDMHQGEGISCDFIDEAFGAKEKEHVECSQSPSHVSTPEANNVNGTNSTIASKKALNETRCSRLAASPVSLNDHLKSIFDNSASFPSSDTQISTVSPHFTSVPNNGASSCTNCPTSVDVSYSKNSSTCKLSTKEFKLNPRAKVFSPTSANSRLFTPVFTNANAEYISNSCPIMPCTASQSGVDINSFANQSTPAKLHDSLVDAHCGVPVQYARPVIGHVNAWQLPVRFSGRHHPVQAGPAYGNLTSQPNTLLTENLYQVMVGRTGQLVYMHPVAQDATQGAPFFSQGSPYPLLHPCQTNLPKIQGIAPLPTQLCMAPSMVTTAVQPFAVPGHIPFSQPFPAVRPPIVVPGGNRLFGSKLQ